MTHIRWSTNAPLSRQQSEDQFLVLSGLNDRLTADPRIVLRDATVWVDGVEWTADPADYTDKLFGVGDFGSRR